MINCPQCANPLPDDAVFCSQCGAKLIGEQQALVSPNDHFALLQKYISPELSAKILSTGKSVEGERRHVTVLFADISGFTSMSERLDPEVVSGVLNDLFRGLVSIVVKYEGMVDKFIGDEIMAIFGAPLAHEDDPERAVRCSVEMLQYIERYNDLSPVKFPQPLSMHIGLNSGIVVAGNVGSDLRMNYSVIGDTVNLAARLVSEAPSGKVYMSADTYRLVSNVVETESPIQLQLKGKSEQVVVYALRNVKKSQGKASIQHGTMVGRKKELERIDSMISALQERKRQSLHIRGEAGVGKTRLKGELTTLSSKKGIPCFEGKCSSYEMNTPYYLWNSLLRNMLKVSIESPESEVRRRLHDTMQIVALERYEPYVAALLSLRYEEILFEEDKERKQKIFEGVRELIQAYAKRGPAVFIFDDLHWVDKFSQELLEFVLTSQISGSAMFVSLFRDEYKAPAKFLLDGELMDLNRMDREEAADLVRLRFDATELPKELEELIVQRSEGNPFFIEQIIKGMLDKKQVEVKKKRVNILAENIGSMVPESVQGIIMARIDRLEERLRQVLLGASVIGREFSRPVLEEILEKQSKVAPSLIELKSLELILEKEEFKELEYLFKHYLIQEVAYNTLLQKQRKKLHGTIAKAIEKLYADRINEFYELLAFHYEKAEDWEKAATYLSRAGRKAEEIFSKQESEGFYERKTEAVKKLYSTRGSDRPILASLVKIFTLIVAIPAGLGMIGISGIGLYAIVLMLKYPPHQPLLLVISLFPFVIFFAVLYFEIGLNMIFGFTSASFKKSARLYDILEDHILITLSDGSVLRIPYAEIIATQLRSFRGFNTSVPKYLSGLFKRLKGNYSFALRWAFPWNVYFTQNRKHNVAPPVLGISAKEGMIVVYKRTGYGLRKRMLNPWVLFVPAKSKEIGLTPANPAEFYKQLSFAFEKWRLKYDYRSYKNAAPLQREPTLILYPKYNFLNIFISISLVLFYFSSPGILNVIQAIGSYPGESFGLWITSLIIGILFLIPPIWAIISLIKYRKNYEATDYTFLNDRLTYNIGFAGIKSGEILYSDINEINLFHGLPKSLFHFGVIEIVSAKPIEFLPGLDKKPTLYLFDIADAEENYRKIRAIVFGEQKEKPKA